MKKMFFTTITTALILLSSCQNDSKPKLSEAELDAMAEEAYNEKMAELENERMAEMYVWQYSESVDEMTSKKNKYAQVTSEDVVYLEFPYEGGTYMTLYVRNSDGNEDAFVSVSKGQLHTDYNDQTMIVRFDDQEPVRIGVNESADGDSEIMFFDNTKSFIKNLKESDSVKIQCMFYNQGSHVYTFNTKDFKW